MPRRPILTFLAALLLFSLAPAGLLASMGGLSASLIAGKKNSSSTTPEGAEVAAPFKPPPASKIPDDLLRQLGGLISPSSASSPPHLPLLKVKGLKKGFLRSFAAERYDGRRWKVEREVAETYRGEILQEEISGFSGVEREEVSVEVLAREALGFLPTSANTERLEAPSPLLYHPNSGSFSPQGTPPASYSFSALDYRFDESTLMKAEVAAHKECLELPPNITPRTRELAQRLTEGLESPYEKLKAIEHYLEVNYRLDPRARPAPQGWEPTDWFLFEERRGGEVDLNSALAILSRAAGVPARLAFGFSGLKKSPEEQLVYADQAHTWVEVPFENLGWIPFDATPPEGRGRVSEVPEGRPGAENGKKALVLHIRKAPSRLEKGSSFEVQGEVKTKEGEAPPERVPVEIFLSRWDDRGGELVGTGEAIGGKFSLSCRLPQNLDAGAYRLIAHSLGTPKHAGSWSEPKSVSVVNPSFPWWPFAFIPAGGGALGYFLRRRSRSVRREAEARPAGEALAAEPPVEVGAGGARLSLRFPEIGEGFPAVWGVGEELTLAFSLHDEQQNALAGKALRVFCDGEKLAEFHTDAQGQVRLRGTFKVKGEHLIAGVFPGEGALGPIEVVGKLRIVDYREEIAALFHRLLGWARSEGSFAPQASPREVQRALESLGVKPKPLGKMVSLFEEASYSQHPISRRHYETAFLALGEICPIR